MVLCVACVLFLSVTSQSHQSTRITGTSRYVTWIIAHHCEPHIKTFLFDTNVNPAPSDHLFFSSLWPLVLSLFLSFSFSRLTFLRRKRQEIHICVKAGGIEERFGE